VLAANFTVAVAANGRDALLWLDEHPLPSLILLDLMMPEMDGFEFLSELRAEPAWQEIPVIVLTAKELTPEEWEYLGSRTKNIIAKSESAMMEISQAIQASLAATRENA
jgi:CheY-like chemotaxis protein